VENETDAQQLTIPVTIPLIIGIFLMLHAFQYPDSSLSFWGSIIPFTSPMVMMARIPFGVPFWQVALSLSLLLITFIGIAWVAGKIYRTGILMYGKKPTLKELLKWINYKN
jgi:ABC-2 type transport system permease protein